MSQAVRKLQKGDKAPQVELKKLFKDGNRDISAELILKNANYNLLSYLDNKSWSRKKRQAFLDAYSDMITSINDGTISERDSGRRYIDSSGKISNSKGRGFDAYGEAAHFIGTIVDALPDYKDESKTKLKDKYDSKGLMTLFRNKTFGGNAPDMEIWQNRDVLDEATGKRGTSNRAEYFASILDEYTKSLDDTDYDYKGSAYTNKEDLVGRLKLASQSLRDGTFDNSDYNALTAIGISGEDARLLFSTGNLKEKTEPEDNRSQEAKDADKVIEEELKRKQELERILLAKLILLDNQLKSDLNSQYIERAKNFKTRSIYLPKVSYNKEKWANIIKGKVDSYYDGFEKLFTKYNPIDNQNLRINNGVVGGTPVSYLQHLANNLDYLGSNIGEDLGNGYYYLPYTYNEATGTAAMYNPSTRHYVEEAVYRIPAIWNKIQNERRAEYMNPQFNFKEGGTIKLQSGGYFRSKGLEALNEEYLNSLQTFKEKEVLKKATLNKRTPEQEKAGNRKPSEDEWTATDWARIGAAAADVASAISAFVPVYGTAASAVTGVGSSLTTFGADWAEDGLDWGDVKNLGINLGADLVGLVPGFGTASKTGKILKNLVKYVPRIMVLLLAKNLVDENVINSFKKIGGEESLTVDDWRNIGSGLTAVAGLSRAGAASMKARSFKAASKTGDLTITNKSGKQLRVTPEQLQGIKEAKTLSEANKRLQSIKGYEKEELASNFKHGLGNVTRIWNNNPTVREHYDFSGQFKDGKGRVRNFSPSNWREYFRDENIYRGSIQGRFAPNGISVNIGNPYKFERTTPVVPSPEVTTSKPLTPQQKAALTRKRNRIDKAWQKRFDEDPKYEFRKEGGVIRKAQKGMRNVLSGDVNWGKHIYGSKGFWDTLNMITPENLDTYNAMLNTYSTLGFTDLKPGDNLSYSGLVANYQDTFLKNTLVNNLTMRDLVNSGTIKGRGSTTDKGVDWKSDGLGGTQTWLRHLGTKVGTNQEMLAEMNKRLNARGIEAFYNDNTGMVNYRKLTPKQEKISTPVPLNTETPVTTTSNIPNKSTTVEKAGSNPSQFGAWMAAFHDQLPNFLAAGRLAGNIMNNNAVAKETIKGLKPLLRDAYNLQRNIYGDLGTKQAYYKRAALMESFAARPRTSDASLQLAGELDANVKGNELRQQGDLADNQMIRQTAELAWQTEADNTARRSEVANANRASMLGIQKAKHDVEAARKSANWQSIENFLKEKEYRARTNLDRQRLFDLNVTERGLREILNDPRLRQLENKLRTSDVEDIITLPEYNLYITLRNQLENRYTDEQNKAYAGIYGLRYRPYKTTYNPVIQLNKDGGKVEVARIKARTENAKIFLDDIKESVKNHIKMIDNLSSVTKELIVKSMTL